MTTSSEIKITKEQFIQDILATKVCSAEVAKEYADDLEYIYDCFMIADYGHAVNRIDHILYEHRYSFVIDFRFIFTALYLHGLHAKSIDMSPTIGIRKISTQYDIPSLINMIKEDANNPDHKVGESLEKLLADFSKVTNDEFDLMYDHFIENNPLFAFLEDE